MKQLLRSNWNPQRGFFILLALTLVFRFWFGVVFPITGDEAYFIWWGQIPDWGFYDHPPMIGWWLALLLKLSSAEWWLRVPVLIQPAVLALAVAAYLKKHGQTVAWGAATLVLLAPVNVWNIFITTDTPLIYFSVLSGLAWLMARRKENENESPWLWYLLAGVGLAGAVLSKYFAVFLGFAYLLDTLYRPTKQKFLGLFIAYACTLPGIGLMAWWNASHCWPNIMFNVYNRNDDAGLSWKTPLMYVGMLLYMFTPACYWQYFKSKKNIGNGDERRALFCLGVIPFILFGILSLPKQIGLHWVLSFIPFALMLLAIKLNEVALRRLVRFFVGFAALHMVAIVVIANLPMETWKRTHLYDGIVLTFESKQLLKQLEPYPDYAWMMDGYSNAVTVGYNTFAQSQDAGPRYIGVFGEASSHARHDDILTDFHALEGKNIAILRKSPPQDGDYERFFDGVQHKMFDVRGATFYLTLGQGFKYAIYRDEVLANVKRKYYAIPKALPQTACYFCDRYFPGQPCQR